MSTPKKALIKSTISLWYSLEAALAKGTSYSSIRSITGFLKCLNRQSLIKFKDEVSLFWFIGAFKKASLQRFFKSTLSYSLSTELV